LLTSCCSFDGPVAQDSRANAEHRTDNEVTRRFMIPPPEDEIAA
jgi:hypothetical protein